jgi:hypothetical protein
MLDLSEICSEEVWTGELSHGESPWGIGGGPEQGKCALEQEHRNERMVIASCLVSEPDKDMIRVLLAGLEDGTRLVEVTIN